MRVYFISTLFILLLPIQAIADHIFGGYISMQQVDAAQGNFRFSVNLYIDDARGYAGYIDELKNYSSEIKIFRKKDNVVMDKFYVPYESSRSIIFDNPACAAQKNFKISAYVRAYIYKVDIDKYDDPDGYYMVTDICCRNIDLTNVDDPGNNTIMFYTEFPALKQNGQIVNYSTPEFPPINGDFICLNKLFKFDFSATDKDGDQLKYYMAEPWQGPKPVIGVSRNDPPPAPYNSVDWSAGYNQTNAIPGNPALKIEVNSGQLSVKANKTGLFLFSVMCEEWRNGKRIGVVKHDFQLPVIQCSLTTPPAPVISYQGNKATEVSFCPGETITLETDNNANWVFQWQKNGDNIPNETQNKLVVSDFGEYQVVKSFKSTCSSDTISQVVKLKNLVATPKIKADNTNICNNASIKLSVENPDSNHSYLWSYKNTPVQTSNEITVTKEGWYVIQAKKNSGLCFSDKDSILITKTISAPLPDPDARYEACSGDSIQLKTVNSNLLQYQWQVNNNNVSKGDKSTLWVKDSGNYTVKVKDDKGCEVDSKIYKVTISSSITVKFDTIFPFCLIGNKKIALAATPPNGVFSGTGINNNIFDANLAGQGKHYITYTYKSPSGCSGKQTRVIQVNQAFTLSVTPQNSTINKGESVNIVTNSSNPNVLYHWHPETYLDDHHIANPVATPDKTITYTVVATSDDGCTVSETIKIIVLGTTSIGSQIYFPNTFTPNMDGKNDEFAIFGNDIESFLLLVYNKWGEPVFESNDINTMWNGGWRNELSNPSPSGLYAITIKVTFKNGDKFEKKDAVMLLR